MFKTWERHIDLWTHWKKSRSILPHIFYYILAIQLNSRIRNFQVKHFLRYNLNKCKDLGFKKKIKAYHTTLMHMNSKVNEEKVKPLNFPGKELQFDIYLREVSSQVDHSLLHLMVFKKVMTRNFISVQIRPSPFTHQF